MKNLIFTFLMLIPFSIPVFSQVTVTDYNVHVENNFGGNTPAIKTQGTGQNNSIAITGSAQEWRMHVYTDQSFRLQKFSGPTFYPVKIYNNTFTNALILAEHGVGIGTISPVAALHIEHTTDDALNVGPRTGAAWGYCNVTRPALNTRSISRFRDNTETIVIIEGQLDTYQMTVYGDALASGGSWVNSDKKLKSDIKKVEGALEKIKQLEPQYYSYNKSDQKYNFLNLPEEKQIGFIAQELKKCFPRQ